MRTRTSRGSPRRSAPACARRKSNFARPYGRAAVDPGRLGGVLCARRALHHIASAMMTVTTAKVAGVAHIAAVSPPRADAPQAFPMRSSTR